MFLIHVIVVLFLQEGIWERIGLSVEDTSPRALVEAVVGETREGQHTLRTFLQGVDIIKDAHNLRCVGALKCIETNGIEC